MVVYRCRVAGVLTGSLDFQVRWFDGVDATEARRRVENEVAHTYENREGEPVSWELAEVLAVERFAPTDSGAEVIGFITSAEHLSRLTGPAVTGE